MNDMGGHVLGRLYWGGFAEVKDDTAGTATAKTQCPEVSEPWGKYLVSILQKLFSF